MKIYLAASLFTRLERKWNRDFTNAIHEVMPSLDVILPQDFTTGYKDTDARHNGALFRLCVKGIDSADAVVALLEGDEIDSGTAWEIGYAYAKGKPVIGVRTDFRPGAEQGVNVMLSRACRFLVLDSSFQEDTGTLALEVAQRLKKLNQPSKAKTATPKTPKAKALKQKKPGKD